MREHTWHFQFHEYDKFHILSLGSSLDMRHMWEVIVVGSTVEVLSAKWAVQVLLLYGLFFLPN